MTDNPKDEIEPRTRRIPAQPPSHRTADGVGKRVSDCGDEVVFFVNVKQGQIQELRFQVNACANVARCTQAAAHLARGKSVAQARKDAAPEKIFELLGGLAPEHEHAAEMVFEALAEALTNAARNQAEPWRKLYRTGP